MMAFAYYNEFDPKVAAWLRQLIKNGEIADGEVDERSITDVEASDLRGFTQHHFFAGIGTWSYALRNAGWADDRPVCTASLPCQPFSTAGNRKGKQDERHLLPHFIEIVRQCNFDTIIGEQVPGAIKHGWLDDLYDEMERENYAVGSVVLTAAGADKAHIRQRLFWVANTCSERLQGHGQPGQHGVQEKEGRQGKVRHGATSSLVSGLAHTSNNGSSSCKGSRGNDQANEQQQTRPIDTSNAKGASSPRAIPEESIEWIYCGDEKYRPIKSGIAPLVNGVARGMVYSGGAIDPNNTAFAKTMRIKGYGNAIVADTAQLFIRSFMDIIQ